MRVAWPPGPVLRSLLVTLLVTYLLAAGLTVAVGSAIEMEIPLGSFQSIVWRVGFVMALLWVEIHRQKIHLFLANLGVSRLATMRTLLMVYVVVEVLLLTAVDLGTEL